MSIVKSTFNQDAVFKYLGFTFKPVKLINQKERDFYFHHVCSIGISNYEDTEKFRSHKSTRYDYEEFYKVAKEHNAVADVYLFEDKGLVIPCGNELFAISKIEADKINVKKKIYKTVVCVEMLSEVPYDGEDLHAIASMITTGDCSGLVKVVSREELQGKVAVDEVKRHGTDLEFFQIDAYGHAL